MKVSWEALLLSVAVGFTSRVDIMKGNYQLNRSEIKVCSSCQPQALFDAFQQAGEVFKQRSGSFTACLVRKRDLFSESQSFN